MTTALAHPALDHHDPKTPHLSPHASPRSARAAVWSGRVLTGLIAAFLVVDAVVKLIPLDAVVEATRKVGFEAGAVRPMGAVLLVSTLLHLFRPTQLLGAVLVTAYLGGATATHVHIGTPFWFPVAMGVLLWVAYGLRSHELRRFVLSPLSPR